MSSLVYLRGRTHRHHNPLRRTTRLVRKPAPLQPNAADMHPRTPRPHVPATLQNRQKSPRGGALPRPGRPKLHPHHPPRSRTHTSPNLQGLFGARLRIRRIHRHPRIQDHPAGRTPQHPAGPRRASTHSVRYRGAVLNHHPTGREVPDLRLVSRRLAAAVAPRQPQSRVADRPLRAATAAQRHRNRLAHHAVEGHRIRHQHQTHPRRALHRHRPVRSLSQSARRLLRPMASLVQRAGAGLDAGRRAGRYRRRCPGHPPRCDADRAPGARRRPTRLSRVDRSHRRTHPPETPPRAGRTRITSNGHAPRTGQSRRTNPSRRCARSTRSPTATRASSGAATNCSRHRR